MRKKQNSRMLAKARAKYGKPNYPGRLDKKKLRKETAEEVVSAISETEKVNYMEKKNREIWDEIKEIASEDISPVSYETWIEPCEPLIITDDRIVLMVESMFFKEMLEKRYVAFLQKVAEKVLSKRPVKIEVVTSPT